MAIADSSATRASPSRSEVRRAPLVTPRDRSIWRGAVLATALNIVGMLIVLLELRSNPAVPTWPKLLSMAVGMVLFGVLITLRHRKNARIAAIVFTLNTASIVAALWFRADAIAATQPHAFPFEPNVLGAMTVALLMPEVGVGTLNILAYLGSAVVHWSLLAPTTQLPPNAPVAFIAYGVFSAVLLAYRVHAQRAEERHARIEAENEGRRLIAAVIESTPVALHAIDLDGVITLSEGRVLDAMGYRPGQLVGRRAQDLFEREGLVDARTGKPLVWRDILREVRDGAAVSFDLRRNQRAFEASFVPLRERDGIFTGVACITTDITERVTHSKEREALLERERVARAAAQSAVEVREEFISIASHELRTPLTPLQMGSESLARIVANEQLEPAARAALENWIAMFRRQVDRLSQLVKSMLDMTTIEAGRFQLDLSEVDVGRLARDVCDGFSLHATRAGSPIDCAMEAGLVIRCDRSRIDQLVSNLVSNAIKYGAGKPISVSVARTADGARFVVADHGIGIPAERQAEIFGRFERAVSARSYGGLGLGLYITKNIVDAHGGTIEVESEPGRGTTFVVDIPSAKSTSRPPR